MKIFKSIFVGLIFSIATTVCASDKTTQQNINTQILSNCQAWHKLKKAQSCSYRTQKASQHTCMCCVLCVATYAAHQLSIETPAYLSHPNFHALCFYGVLGKNTCDCIENTIDDCYTRPIQAAEYQELIIQDIYKAYQNMTPQEQSGFTLTHPVIYKSLGKMS
ncbi:hypothetical protein KBD08_03415 [Candidatus Babeliales bacterium]|nr:hypothetical protein [Candidatus Babeliales bacterium]